MSSVATGIASQFAPAEAFVARLRRSWFAYGLLAVFYGLDIYLTILMMANGPFEEINPLNRRILSESGPLAWAAIRIIVLVQATALITLSFALGSVLLPQLVPSGRSALDRLEDLALGTVILLYALMLVHNLAVLAQVAGKVA